MKLERETRMTIPVLARHGQFALSDDQQEKFWDKLFHQGLGQHAAMSRLSPDTIVPARMISCIRRNIIRFLMNDSCTWAMALTKKATEVTITRP